MYLARVVGTVVATVKSPGLQGIKLMLIERLDPAGSPIGRREVACDQAQAGIGDHVYCVGKREATLAMPDPFVPVDAAIVGIVDAVETEA